MLTEKSCANARPKKGGGIKKYGAGGGLFLWVSQAKGCPVYKVWRLRYPHVETNLEQVATFKEYPGMSLADAIVERDRWKGLLKSGVDPKAKEQEAAGDTSQRRTFRAGATVWFASEQTGQLRPKTIHRNSSLVDHANDVLGDRYFDDITSADVFTLYNTLKAKVSVDTAQRVVKRASEIFRFGLRQNPKWCAFDPAREVTDWIIEQNMKRSRQQGGDTVSKRPSIVRTGVLPQWLDRLVILVARIDGYNMRKESGPFTKLAMQFMMLTSVRPGMVCDAEWSEIDLKHNVWTIPKGKMKMARDFVVPLSRQAVAILERLRPLTDRPGNKWVFSPHTNFIPLKTRHADGTVSTIKHPCGMSTSTIGSALQRMGYDTSTEQCGHGFRSISFTLLQEDELWDAPWPTKTVKLHHAHKTSKGTQTRYDESQNWSKRVTMAQAWADFIDKQRPVTHLRLVG